jgi:hypothetical protein
MTLWVVETNVGGVANDDVASGKHDPECVLACVRFLGEVMKSGRVVLDSEWEIINEYRHILRSSGQPGVGDAFLKWILTHRANPSRCQTVDTAAAEIPDRLAGFDPADHKFIRAAVAAPQSHIAEASDSEWWSRRADFEAAGIPVEFLCPAYVTATSGRKYGKPA